MMISALGNFWASPASFPSLSASELQRPISRGFNHQGSLLLSAPHALHPSPWLHRLGYTHHRTAWSHFNLTILQVHGQTTVSQVSKLDQISQESSRVGASLDWDIGPQHWNRHPHSLCSLRTGLGACKMAARSSPTCWLHGVVVAPCLDSSSHCLLCSIPPLLGALGVTGSFLGEGPTSSVPTDEGSLSHRRPRLRETLSLRLNPLGLPFLPPPPVPI